VQTTCSANSGGRRWERSNITSLSLPNPALRALSDLGALPNRLDSGLSAYVYGFVQHGYTEMNASEAVRRNSLEKNNETFLRSATQVRSTVQSATLAVPGGVVRSAEDRLVEQGIHSRQDIQASAIALDERSARYQRSQADVDRAAKNILEWKKYLPDDCINAMVARDWHFTV
jgi:hypothetical protein